VCLEAQDEQQPMPWLSEGLGDLIEGEGEDAVILKNHG
jgi:hypothetical protein